MFTPRRWLILLTLVAATLRFHGLFANTFHADEALFATWARLIGIWRDPLLQSQLVDKPPLLFYLQALFYPLLATPAPWVARLPNLIASILLVPLTARLVATIYRDSLAAIAAAAFVTLSPFTIQFSATGFTDPLLAMLVVASVACQVRGVGDWRLEIGDWRLEIGDQGSAVGEDWEERASLATNTSAPTPQASGLYPLSSLFPLAGLLFGLAVVTKHQAWLFLPLVAALGWLERWRWAQWRRWLSGFLPVLLALLAWDVARNGTFTLWQAQMSSYGGLRLAWSWELWPRLAAWGDLWQVLFGSQVLLFLLLLALPVFLALLIYHQDWPTAYDQLFLLYLLAYGALHWFLAVPVWDRYLLPVIPLVALLLSRFLSRLVTFVGPELPRAVRIWLAPALLGLLILLHLPAAWAAREGTFLVGGRPGADGGAAEVAAFLQNSPYGTVLYDHWYSWQWRYHLFDSGVYVNWFPHPAALAEDLRVFGEREGARYLALPSTPVVRPVLRAVRDAGFNAEKVASSRDITLYQLLPDATVPADD